MCNCIEEVNALLEEQNAMISLLIIGPQKPMIELTKIDTKKRGKLPVFFATFCPFCGNIL